MTKQHSSHIFFIHSSVVGELGCFHTLAVVNSSTRNTRVHVLFWIMVYGFLRVYAHVLSSEISGSYGSSIFNCLRNLEGNGTPLQYSCLENPMDGGAWRAAVHGVVRVEHDWVTSLSLFTFMHWRRKWQPTPVFLPGESQGWGSLVGCHLWGHTE